MSEDFALKSNIIAIHELLDAICADRRTYK